MNPNVLMVDDNPGDLQLIEEAFKDSGIPVVFHAAGDASSAFEHLTRAEIAARPLPDVIILDLNLPGMHGLEVITALRANLAWKHIPIVVFSGEDTADAHGLGADEVVVKPASYGRYLALAQRLRRYWPSDSGSGRTVRRAARAAARSLA